MIDYELSNYQQLGSNFLVDKLRAILALYMGMGKTVVACDALKRFDLDALKEPVTILCPRGVRYEWRNHLVDFTGLQEENVAVIHGISPARREKLWKRRRDFQAVITNYDTYMRDMPKGWAPQKPEMCIMDEAHRMRNRKTKAFKVIRGIRTDVLWELSGTIVRRGPQDLWTLLYFLDRKAFSSYWRFVETYCIVDDSGYGREILGVRNAEALRQRLAMYMFHRKPSDVPGEMPEARRQPMPLDLDPKQRKVYDQLVEDMLAEIPSGGVLMASTILSLTIRLRQILVCPKILDPELPYGTGVVEVVDRIQDQPNGCAVIFTPFVEAIPHVKELLHSRGYENVFYLHGRQSDRDFDYNKDQFKKTEGIMICSLAMAEGFELQPAKYGYFLGYSYDPDVNEQAEYRLVRKTGKEPVNFYYVRYYGTVDDRTYDIVNEKYQNVQTIMKSPEGLKWAFKGS